MQKQKRGFWLFIFSLIPGAGEMYMGFKKQGISIMFLFWGVFAIGACTGMDWLVFLIPIIWFYSFFNVHNLKSLSEEEFYSIEDSYVLHMDELAGDISSLLKHHGKITAILLIFLGASILLLPYASNNPDRSHRLQPFYPCEKFCGSHPESPVSSCLHHPDELLLLHI